MCGILGVLTSQKQKNSGFKKALDSLYHRGPDDQGIWTDDHIQLGHTRLSILDLSPLGHQPMSYQSERYWITYNGEIYNYLELKEELISLGYTFISKTDTEVLLAAYAQWGKFCLEKLRGMFAFAIWDRKEKSLFLGRDRVGEKPLYYFHDQNNFYFASELKSLLHLLPQTPRLDPISIDLYLYYRYVPEPRTPFLDVYKLPAAHYLLIDYENWKIQPQKYWDLEQIPPVNGNPVERIREELDKVIGLTLRSDVPVGIALSGGIDSGGIAALAAPKYKDKLQAFSIGYPGRPDCDERKQAEELAKKLGLPFFELELRTEDFVNFFPELVAAKDDPISDLAAYGHYSVNKLSREHDVKVMLSGIGGDELFWGYNWLLESVELTEKKTQFLANNNYPTIMFLLLEKVTKSSTYQTFIPNPKVPKSIREILQQGKELEKLSLAYPQQAVYQELVLDFQNALNYTPQIYHPEFQSQIPSRNCYQLFQLKSLFVEDIPIQICQFIFDTWLVSNCLALGDRLSMASSIETRMPLVDYKLIELVIGLRKTNPDHGFGQKHWLKETLQGILPDEVLQRPKRGFEIPLKDWMENIILKYLDKLASGYLIQLKVLNQSFIFNLIDEFKLERRNMMVLYKLLVLEIWYRSIVS